MESDKRQYRRTHVLISGTVHQGASSFECIIKDLSAGGAQIQTEQPISRGRDVVLDIHRAGLFNSRMMWHDGNRIGMAFLQEPESVAKRIGSAWGISD